MTRRQPPPPCTAGWCDGSPAVVIVHVIAALAERPPTGGTALAAVPACRECLPKLAAPWIRRRRVTMRAGS